MGITLMVYKSSESAHNDFHPNKRLGQNFLINKGIVGKIIAAADLKSTDNVLEVGPGKGILTFQIAERVKRLVAVEKDVRLFEILSSKCQEQSACLALKIGESRRAKQVLSSKFKVLNADILEISEKELRAEFKNEHYKIVANLPYQITSFFLRKFLDGDYQPTEMILMLQKEVAQRIVAKPGEMSLLSASVQFFCDPQILFYVSKGSFSPAPKVDSAVIHLENIRKDKFGIEQEKFFDVVKRGFQFKRKLLTNNLKITADKLRSLGLNEKSRAQELSMDEWIVLINGLRA